MAIITEKNEFDKNLTQSLQIFCKKFNLYSLIKRFGAKKTKGIAVSQVFDFLISLVFLGRNLYSTISKDKQNPFSKDTVYRFLNDTKVNWEKILLLLATTVIEKLRPLTDEKRLTAIVVDDSPYRRNRSKKVELLAKVFDHVSHKCFMGFRMLTLGFTDGNTFIPFATQLMSSVKTKNASGSTDGRTLSAKRKKNALKEMPQRLYELLKTAKSLKIPAQHVLFDSWFSNPVTLLAISEIGFFCVAMLKKTKTKYRFNGKIQTLSQIYQSVKKRPGKSKYLASVLVTVLHKDFQEPLETKIVFIRDKNNKKNWCALISTDTSLSEEEIIALYGKRWDIEVFFKMCKSYLNLAKEFEGRSYDMMTAHTVIVFIRYICLAWTKRESEDLRCFGELFYLVQDELSDVSFLQAFDSILSVLADTLDEFLLLSHAQISSFIDAFLAKLPCCFRLNKAFLSCES